MERKALDHVKAKRVASWGLSMIIELSILLVMILVAGAAGGLTILTLDRSAPGRFDRSIL